MIFNQGITDSQFERLKTANELHKYGALETWQELFMYQQFCKDKEQIIKIGQFAKRKDKGEDIKLPLKENIELIEKRKLERGI
jgi:hypothetical protein